MSDLPAPKPKKLVDEQAFKGEKSHFSQLRSGFPVY